MESTPRYSPSFDVESRERLEARMGAPIPLPEHYGHGPVDVDGGHPEVAPSSKENSPPPSPADHGPMNIDEQQPAMAPSSKEESRAKQRSLRR
jgi:hypothetical protein